MKSDTHCLKRHIDIADKVGIDRHKVIFTRELRAEPGEINNGDGVGSGGGDLTEKFAKRFPQRCLIQIARR